MKRIVMIGTELETCGGVSSVVGVLREYGLFKRCGIEYFATHYDGEALTKIIYALHSGLLYITWLILRRIALVHAHTASRASFWRKCFFLVPAILVRVPVVIHLHGAEFQHFYSVECSAWARRIIRWVFEQSSRVVVLSESWRNWVISICPAARVTVIYNPVSVPAPVPESQREPHTLLFLGRLGQRKGIYDLLAVVAALVGKYPDLHLVVGGDGAIEEVRSSARELGIEAHVHLLGWVRGAEKNELFERASIFALPSYNEGLPMSILEAMAHGLPILSTLVGGIPTAVSDEGEGFLVQPGDQAALRGRLDRLLGDEALRRRLGAAARVKAENSFSAGHIVERIVQLYGELGCAC